MKPTRTVCGLGLVLLLGLTATADDDHKGTYEALKKLAAQGDDMKKAGVDEAKKREMELEAVMHAFKLPSKGGLGYGEKPGPNDGLEARLYALGRKDMTPRELAAQERDLVALARISAAIASVALPQSPVDKPVGAKTPAKWKEFGDEMYNTALELAKASKARDAKAIKTAANKLYKNCNECHSIFRD
jgi:hypothetical protein